MSSQLSLFNCMICINSLQPQLLIKEVTIPKGEGMRALMPLIMMTTIIKREIKMVRRKHALTYTFAETLFDAYTRFLPLQAAFPTINKLMHVALTFLVSIAQCERSFSTLGRIKTHLRSTMSNNRLADISLLSLERETYVPFQPLLKRLFKNSKGSTKKELSDCLNTVNS